MPSSLQSAGEAVAATSTPAAIGQLATFLAAPAFLVGAPHLASLLCRAAALVEPCPWFLQIYGLPGAERLDALLQLIAEQLEEAADALHQLRTHADDAQAEPTQRFAAICASAHELHLRLHRADTLTDACAWSRSRMTADAGELDDLLALLHEQLDAAEDAALALRALTDATEARHA